MTNDNVTDEWLGVNEFLGIPEGAWTVLRVKQLLRGLIKSQFIYTVPPVVLKSFLNRKGVLNIGNRHDDFFRDLAKASRTASGKAAIEEYANSGTEVQKPPSLEEYVTPGRDEENGEQDIATAESLMDIPQSVAEQEPQLPRTVKQIFENSFELDSITDDELAMKFYMQFQITDYWKRAFYKEDETIKEIKKIRNSGNEFSDTAVETFLKEYDQTKNLKIPKGYEFRDPKTKKLVEPFLMQFYVAQKLKNTQYFGNFSGTGAGKTLSAVLASRTLNSKMTLVICPNDVVNLWNDKIKEIFPDSDVILKKEAFFAKYDEKKFQYLIINYDKLNQESSPNDVLKLIKQKIDFVILDEIHFSKTTKSEEKSVRRHNLDGLLSGIRKKNKDVRVLGLSATPVVNNLTEGKSLLQLITGQTYEHVSDRETEPNAITLYENIIPTSIRQIPIYKKYDKEYPSVEVTDIPKNLSIAQLNRNPKNMEFYLTQARLGEIIKRIDGQTIIYTEYLGAPPGEKTIFDLISNAVEEADFTWGRYTGENHSGLKQFLNKEVQVLIASKPISTGIDGLQEVCSNLIFNTLPWTNALYQQIIGRIVRTGQDENKTVKVHHIIASIGGFPYDEGKLLRLHYKETLADCAVDGTLPPDKKLVTPKQAMREAVRWLERLERGEISVVTRRQLDVVLTPVEIKTRLRKFGDFSKLNRQINTEKSSSTHKRMLKNPEEWHEYHRQYREARKEWRVIPYEYWIKKINKMAPNTIIGDFGCGEAKIRESIGARVKSFDHVSIDSTVESCDMKSVPVDSGTLNVVVFSLSLMGKDWQDYLKEAARCLSVGGYLYISETTKSLSERLSTLRDVIAENGFEIFSDSEKSNFTFIEARKI